MLLSGATSKNYATTMNLRRIIQTDITASAVAHLALLALLLLFSEVHRFGEVTAETVAVDIVTPQEIAEKAVAENKPESAPTPTPQLDFSLLDKPAAASTPTPASQPAAPAPPQKQAAAAASRAAPAPSPPQAQTAAQAFTPPAPDLSIKYHVMLGLPPDLSPTPPRSRSGVKAGDDFDAPAIESADIGSSPVTESSPSPDMLETSGRLEGFRRRQGQAAGIHDAGRQAGNRSCPDRGQRQREGAVADAGRHRRAAGLPALRHAAGGPLRRMEGARPQFYAAGFRRILIGEIKFAEKQPVVQRSSRSLRKNGCRTLPCWVHADDER
jgi:hypothetical protein